MLIIKQLLQRFFCFVFLVDWCCSGVVYAADFNDPPPSSETSGEIVGPPAVGDFALRVSQQPGPLISFGQNIIDQNALQLFLLATDVNGVDQHAITFVPAVLYGVTDNLSLFVSVPVAASFRQQNESSAGMQDILVQMEYLFYSKNSAEFADQATIVGNITLPSGSASKQPPTGSGSPSFFLGPTFNRSYPDWFIFTSHGVLLVPTHETTHAGSQFLYQFGLGRNIADIESKWIFAGMVEVDGQYAWKNTINGSRDPNSGGNVIYTTPSLWISSNNLVIQLGIGFAMAQHLMGNQKNNHYLLAANIGWTF